MWRPAIGAARRDRLAGPLLQRAQGRGQTRRGGRGRRRPVRGKACRAAAALGSSSDDVEVLDALVEAGADIEAPGSVINGGSPLADAVAFGQWRAARRLVELGARANLWQAAALGLADRLDRVLAADPRPGRDEITNGFWCA